MRGQSDIITFEVRKMYTLLLVNVPCYLYP